MIAPRGGVHLTEWSAEALGTALLLLGGISAICLNFGRGAFIAAHLPSTSARLLLTGLLFSGSGSLVAVSPLGRRSGAHLNPVVTLAFRITGMVHAHDLAGYIAAQCAGAIAGAGLARLVWGNVAVSIGDGTTHPGTGMSPLGAVGIEALMTGILIATIFLFVSRTQLLRWTPLAVVVVVTGLVWQGAPYTGTSLNPARSLGPAIVIGNLSNLWIYVVGPVLGGCAVALAWQRFPAIHPMTAKLFHDVSYPSTLGGEMPVSSIA